MRKLFLFACFNYCSTCFCQKQDGKSIDTANGIINFYNCDLNPFVVDDGTLGIKYNAPEGLEKYFEKKFNNMVLRKIQGEILIQALIDKKGKICCKSVSSPSGLSLALLDSLRLDNIIDLMPQWQPAKMEGKKWNSSILLSVRFYGAGQIKVLLKQMTAILK